MATTYIDPNTILVAGYIDNAGVDHNYILERTVEDQDNSYDYYENGLFQGHIHSIVLHRLIENGYTWNIYYRRKVYQTNPKQH